MEPLRIRTAQLFSLKPIEVFPYNGIRYNERRSKIETRTGALHAGSRTRITFLHESDMRFLPYWWSEVSRFYDILLFLKTNFATLPGFEPGLSGSMAPNAPTLLL